MLSELLMISSTAALLQYFVGLFHYNFRLVNYNVASSFAFAEFEIRSAP